MENNKYDDFYFKLSTNVLIEQLRFNIINGGSFLNDWHEELIRHLKNRVLSVTENDLLEHILNSDPSILKIEHNRQVEIELAAKKNIEKNTNKIALNTALIAEAGKSLKIIVYLVILMVLSMFLWILVSPSFEDPNEITIAYTVLGVINILCSFATLTILHNAGDNLEKSVK